MAERINMPPALRGTEREQIEQLRKYLFLMAETMNRNLESIGTNELTDDEKRIMNGVLDDRHNSLRQMIVRTAEYAQKTKDAEDKADAKIIRDIAALQEFDRTLSGIKVFSGRSVNTAANNNKFQFQLPFLCHAIVCIAYGFASFFIANTPPQLYTTTMPDQFSATLESDNTTVTINRSTNILYYVHGIILT